MDDQSIHSHWPGTHINDRNGVTPWSQIGNFGDFLLSLTGSGGRQVHGGALMAVDPDFDASGACLFGGNDCNAAACK